MVNFYNRGKGFQKERGAAKKTRGKGRKKKLCVEKGLWRKKGG